MGNGDWTVIFRAVRWLGDRGLALDDYPAGTSELFCGSGANAPSGVLRSTAVRGGTLVFLLLISRLDDVGEGTSVVDTGIECGSASGALGCETLVVSMEIDSS